jgi:hypothetical protein
VAGGAVRADAEEDRVAVPVVAQALEERLVLITGDEMILRYDVPTMPA